MSSPPVLQLNTALSTYAAALPRHARLIQLAGEVLRQLAAVQAGLPPVPGMADSEVEAKLAAGQAIVDQVPIPVSIFQNTLSHLLELFRQFELMPPLSAARLQNLLTLPPHAWLDETSVAASCQDQDLPAGLFLFLGRKALFPFYHEAAAPFRQKSIPGRLAKREMSFLRPGTHSGQLRSRLRAKIFILQPLRGPMAVFSSDLRLLRQPGIAFFLYFY